MNNMFSVLLSNETSIRSYQFSTLEEACTYAYQHKKEFCTVSVNGRFIYNNIRVEDRKVIFENIWAKELLE